MNRARLLVVIAIIAALAAVWWFDLTRFLNLDYLQSQLDGFKAYRSAHPVWSFVLFMLIYIAVTALSIPGAALLTLLAGALFGLLTGTILVSFASTIGATLAFLASRFLLRDWVQDRFGDKLGAINRGVEKEGAFYLFTLRLIPIFPFFVINLLMGLTPMRTLVYALVSQIGMLPATIVYVNAGSQLATIESASDILSPALIFSFALLGLFPLIARKLLDFVRARREPGNNGV